MNQSAVRQKPKKPNGGDVTRPRAADDFPAIRARLEELRRERAAAPVDAEPRRPDGPRPYAAGSSALRTAAKSSGLSPLMRRGLLKVRTV
jgi:hypothetical protein